jgi:hypothetical protein
MNSYTYRKYGGSSWFLCQTGVVIILEGEMVRELSCMEDLEIHANVYIVAYLLKAGTMEPEKQPLLGNARKHVMIRDVTRTAVAMEQLDKHVRGDVTQQ